MARGQNSHKKFLQSGFRVARRDPFAEHSGWRPQGKQKKRKRNGCAPEKPEPRTVVLFGPDDEFVATFEGRSVEVIRFDDIGRDQDPFLRAKLDPILVRVRPAGRAMSLVLYALDAEGRAWSVDFRAHDADAVNGLSRRPRLRRIAEDLDARLNDLVVLHRSVVLQALHARGGYDLWAVDRRSGVVEELGGFDLDPDLSTLDPVRSDILLGRHKGDVRLILFGDAAASGRAEIHAFATDRVTGATVADGTYLVLARKGGLLQKADLRAALPDPAPGSDDSLARACHKLRELLKRCGCDCECEPVPGGDGPGGEDGDDRPCDDRHSAQIGFTAARLHRVGANFVAVDQSARRMAVLDDRLNVKFERKLDRDGVDLQPGQVHTQNLLIHQARMEQIEAWGIADYVREIEPRLPDGLDELIPTPLPSVTYWGQKNPRAELNPTVRVCIFPVIDGGQTYGDPDMDKLIDQVSAKMFGKVDDYYDECSFGETGIDFTVFGHDLGGSRKPLVLPRPQASYWWDAFRAGGLKAVMPADWSDPVVFDGNEALEIQANPRAGAVKSYDVPFAAMWSNNDLGSFPISLTFTGSETLELDVVTQTGDNHTLTLSFPSWTRTLNQGGDVETFLDDLAQLFTDRIRDAESSLAGDPTLIQDVEFRRVRTSDDDSEFGLAQGRFRIAPDGGATQKGRISVSGPATPAAPLAALGLSPPAVMTGVMDSTLAVEEYFRECLRATRVDAGEGFDGSTAYFSTTPETDFDATAQEITVLVNLTRDTGGQEATIELVSSSGLGGTGWDSAMPNPGSKSGPNNTNTLRDAIDLADDTFTTALDHIRATTAWNRSAVEAMFENFDVMMIAHVGAPHPGIPAADQWSCDDPADFASKRMYRRTHFATDQNPPAGEDPVQMGTRAITGVEFRDFNNPQLENQAGTMAHELGHAIGLPDLYWENGFRDDVMYVDPWAMMGGGYYGNFHHFCGWSKWKVGWIADDPDPNVNRTMFVDLPSAASTSVTEAWLVPVEYWDSAMRADVRDGVGGSVPIGQLMKLNLGSDGGITAFLELRAEGSAFSQNLSPEPTVIATNGLDPDSDRHWAVNGLYRRSVHLLNTGTELRNTGDTWDFATAPEFPVKGCIAEVADVRTVRGSIPVYLVRVEREQAEYIDLHFQDHVPGWKSPDIWVDWRGDNPNPDVPRVYPVGTPTDQGETVRFPASGIEPHYVVARVHNAGNVRAEDVRVRWFVCDPPGAGDDGRWVKRATQTIPEIAPDDNEITAFDWAVDASTSEHQCMRMEIIDWTVPSEVDPATGDTVALASDDVKLQNNNAQQNVFDFEAIMSSPYDPIEFPMQVHNDRLRSETAALVPDRLPYGAKLTITPREHVIPSGEARVFNCKLQLDEEIIRPGCDNDSGFLLSAWRRGGEADEIWGSCFYHVRPRWRTEIEIVRGYWVNSQIRLWGMFRTLTEDPIDLADHMPLVARVRLLGDAPDAKPDWHVVPIQTDGSFELEAELALSKSLVAQAWFDRTDRLASALSNVWEMKQSLLE